MKYKNILWDLDGTLTDPKIGIITCIQYALEKFGATPPPMDDLLWCIGPPLYESFPKLLPGITSAEVHQLVAYYRERFAEVGMFENFIYPDIANMLEIISQKHSNFLTTSKPHLFANKILSHFNLSKYFHRIYGSELSGERSKKGDLIRYIIEMEKLDLENTVMIGDRKHDVVGAKEAGISSVGITWGYGSHEELSESKADYIFTKPSQVIHFFKNSI